MTYCGGPFIFANSEGTIDMTNVYWGHVDGPTDMGNMSGPEDIKGTAFQGIINFEPFLTEPWVPEQEPEPEIDPLILKYEPILYFHENEDFYPMNLIEVRRGAPPHGV